MLAKRPYIILMQKHKVIPQQVHIISLIQKRVNAYIKAIET